MREAEEFGLTPYWLGQSFSLGDLKGRVAEAEYQDQYEFEHLILAYSLGGSGKGSVYVRTYSMDVGGWDVILDGAETIEGTTVVPTAVGAWSGELWTVPFGDRPVNSIIFVLRNGHEVVLATAKSGSTGVPGKDVNPLIDADKWREVLEAHLKPYSK